MQNSSSNTSIAGSQMNISTNQVRTPQLEKLLRQNTPNIFSHHRKSLSCNNLLDLEDVNEDMMSCMEANSEYLETSLSTIDVSNAEIIRKGDEVFRASISEEVSESQVNTLRRLEPENPTSNGKHSRRQRRRRGLRLGNIPSIMGRQFVKIGGGMAHVMEHIIDAIPDLIENFAT